ncbi:MAG: D-alanyl-D-alanine carboxypeptidase [Sumerlaeia bacterium]
MKIQPLSWYGKIAASTAALLLLASSTYAITLAQLQNDIDYVINTSNSNVSWSVKIENNAGNGDLYSKNSTTMRRPASNTKIFTAAAAFRKFGPSYVWQGYQLGSSSTISPIDQILSDSNNSQADSLFSLIGGESAALAQLSNITSTAGMDMNDGSGLNYGNRFNNEQTIDVLRWARNTYTFNQFISLGNQLHLRHAWWQIVWNRKIWSCTR